MVLVVVLKKHVSECVSQSKLKKQCAIDFIKYLQGKEEVKICSDEE
jgi:hypothetical protein